LLVEAEPSLGRSVDSKRMDIARPLGAPVDEVDAELKSGFGRTHHLGFIDTEQIVEVLDVRERSLADAHDSNLVGLNQSNSAAARRYQRDQSCSGHPPGSAAAEDHDFQGFIH